MQVLDFYALTQDEQHFWLEQISKTKWDAADFLISIILKEEFYSTLGNDSKLYLLTHQNELVCFCTFAEQDCIRDKKLFPWIGFVFTTEKYRGNRYAFDLFDYIFETERKKQNPAAKIYIATDHQNLYEKYGFTFLEKRIDVWGDECKIYYKNIVVLPELETSRLKLKMLYGKHNKDAFKWTGDPIVNKYMIYPLYTNCHDVKKWINTLYIEEKQIDYGFFLKDTDELIGSGGIYFHPENNTWAIGYNLRHDMWNKGLVTEAMQKIIEYACSKYDIKKITGTFATQNIASQKVMEKLGMTFDQDTEYSKFDGSQIFKAKIYSKLL